MKKIIPTLILLFLVSSPTVSYSKDNLARKNTCDFISGIIDEGGEAASNILINMFSWDKKAAKQLENSFDLLHNYKYIDGAAFIIADFDNLFEQHFLVITTKENGNLYFYLDFQKLQNQLRLTNASINDSYKEIVDEQGNFAQKPKRINC